MQAAALKFGLALTALVWASVANYNGWGPLVVALLCVAAVVLGWSAISDVIRASD